MACTVTLSVCMIVRDEAERLPAALDSVAAVADEIVVGDAGSTDRSAEIARARGVRVVEVPWQDDFSAARNATLAAATGDWILCLDPDEALVAGQESTLRALLGGSAVDAYRVRVQSPLAAAQAGETFRIASPRLFRNRPEYRFQGRAREQILPALEAHGARVAGSSLVVTHTGGALDREARRAQLERDIRLLQLDLDARPSDAFLLCQLAAAYAAAALQNLASPRLQLDELDAAAAAAERALEVDAGAAPAWLILAAVRTRQVRLDDAVRSAVRYLRACKRTAAGEGWLGFEPDLPRAYLVLGECRLLQGRLTRAWRTASRVLEARPLWPAAHRLAARVLERQGDPARALLHWRRVTELEPDDASNWRQLAQLQWALGDRTVALATLETATQHVDDAGLYRWQGHLRTEANRLADAAESYRNVLRLDPRNQDAHRRLAGLYRKLGAVERALEHLVETLRVP